MKKLRCALGLALCVCLLPACASGDSAEDGSDGTVKYVSKALGVNAAAGEVLFDEDTHGGFHGDGYTFVEVSYGDSTGAEIAGGLAGRSDWSALPLSENLRAAVYGSDTYASLVLTEDASIPAVENGYFYFYDRYSESKDPKSDRELFSRYSYNFTVALYDTDSGHLYYYELDT